MTGDATFRQASVGDLERLTDMGAEFHKASGIPGGFAPQRWIASWTKFLACGVGIIFMLEQDSTPIGAVGFLRFDDPNNGHACAAEAFWYVRPQHRGCGITFLKQAIGVLKSEGVVRLSMVHLESMNTRLDKVYQRMGFQPIERTYWKEI